MCSSIYLSIYIWMSINVYLPIYLSTSLLIYLPIYVSIGENPVVPNRQRCIQLFIDAKTKDMSNSKFATAYLFFKLAYILHPTHIPTLINISIVEYFIYNNIKLGEFLSLNEMIQECFYVCIC